MLLDGGVRGSIQINIMGLGGRGRDPAWLNIRVKVTSRHGTHSGDSDCLESDEGCLLARWLIKIGEGRESKPTIYNPTDGISFTEPYLGFHILEAKPDSIRIEVWLGSPFLPPWVERRVAKGIVLTGREVDLKVDRQQLLVGGRGLLDEWKSVTGRKPEDVDSYPM